MIDRQTDDDRQTDRQTMIDRQTDDDRQTIDRLLFTQSFLISVSCFPQASDDTHIMFTNSIRNNETDIITRSYINITFGCRYPINYMVQQQNGENLIRVDVRWASASHDITGSLSPQRFRFKAQSVWDCSTPCIVMALIITVFQA